MRSEIPRCLAVLLLASLPAQEAEVPVRRWVAGKVRQQSGEPWADVAVTLFSQPWGLIPYRHSGDGGREGRISHDRSPDDRRFDDRVDVRTDANGNFKAEVLTSRTYSAWAMGEVVDGLYRVTDVVDGVSAGVPVQLQEQPEPHVQVRVDVQADELWRASGELRYEIMVMLGNQLMLPCEVEDGAVVLPPAPRASVFLIVRTANMLPVGSGIVPIRRSSRLRQLDGSAPDPNARVSRTKAELTTQSLTRSRIELAEPVSLRVRVRDALGQPLTGAVLHCRDRAEMHPVAHTDAAGLAQLLVPRTAGTTEQPLSADLSFWVTCDGHVLGHYFARDVPLGADEVDVELALYEASSIKGRLMWSAGQPAAHAPILLHSSVPSCPGGAFPRQGGSNSGSPTIYWTDGEGRFEVPGRPGHLSWQLSTVLHGDEPGLPRSRHVPLHSRHVLASGWDTPGKDVELGTLVLGDYVPLEIEVVGADGAPADGRYVYFREEPTAEVEAGAERVCAARTNWAGRLRTLCRPGVTMLLSTKSGAAGEETEVPIPKTATQAVTVRLTLTDGGGR